jgi:hypothetical protein
VAVKVVVAMAAVLLLSMVVEVQVVVAMATVVRGLHT